MLDGSRALMGYMPAAYTLGHPPHEARGRARRLQAALACSDHRETWHSVALDEVRGIRLTDWPAGARSPAARSRGHTRSLPREREVYRWNYRGLLGPLRCPARLAQAKAARNQGVGASGTFSKAGMLARRRGFEWREARAGRPPQRPLRNGAG